MSTIQVQIPDSLQKSLDDLAARDGISIDMLSQKPMTGCRLSDISLHPTFC